MPDEPEPAERSQWPLEINKWNRAALSVLGLAGLGAGGAAVFITHDEAGPVALIAAGLLLLLIGMGGRMPTRLKVGENEAAWEVEREAVQVFVERVAEDATVDRRPELLDALSNLAEVAPALAAPGISGVAYEELVLEMIKDVVYDINKSASNTAEPHRADLRLSISSPPGRAPFDAVLEGPAGHTVPVVIKFSTRLFTMSSVTHLVDQLHFRRQPRDGDGSSARLLLITQTDVSGDLEDLLLPSGIIHVVITGRSNMDRLTRAIMKALDFHGP